MVPEANTAGQADMAAVRSWLEMLHGDSNGFTHVCASGNWAGQVCADLDEAVSFVSMMDLGGRQSIYVRATTLNDYLPPGTRGGANDTACLPALWADIDIAGPGHKTDKPLPTTEADARQIIERSPLPEPTLWVHSGGGLYPWWFLEKPHCPDDLDRIKALSKGWHQIICHAASELGWHYGTEVADLSRVLRIPGTINRKVPDQPRMCQLVDGGCGTWYPLEQLLQAEAAGVAAIPEPEPPKTTAIALPGPSAVAPQGLSPGDALEVEPWESGLLLGGDGWEIHHRGTEAIYWTRPGKPVRDGWSATTGHNQERDRLYVFSSSTPFEPHKPYNKFAAYALLRHGGDYSAAAAQLRRLGYGDPPPSNQPEPLRPPPPVEGRPVDPDDDGVLPAPNAPYEVAKALLADYSRPQDGKLTLRHWRGSWMEWDGSAWVEAEKARIAKGLFERLNEASYWKPGPQGHTLAPWQPDPKKVDSLMNTLDKVVLVPQEVNAPMWLNGHQLGPTVSCRNGILELGTRQLHPPDPDLFNLVSVPFDYNPHAGQPVQWLEFLRSLWPREPNTIRALQQWFGYVLSGRTEQQKMFMLLGPPRSGKGTIVRVLQALVGKGNYTGPTLASFTESFGLQSLIGKSLATVSDARLSKWDGPKVIERLLSISGEDPLRVGRKYEKDWDGKLPTRIMVVSNELPDFRDPSGAIVSRFIITNLTRSWLGSEDTTLEPRLMQELPGILNWAIQGLHDLQQLGRLIEPESMRQSVNSMMESVSPVKTFIEDECEIGEGYEIEPSLLYDRWLEWCKRMGRDHPGTLQRLCRDLKTAESRVGTYRPRDANGKQRRILTGIRLAPVESPESWSPSQIVGMQ